LRELFQFDCADLDFGIYRIMNYKRAVIERFITEDLPKAIAEELEQGALAEQAKVQEALTTARQKVLESLGDDALDVEGNLAEKYRETRAGKEYLAAQQRVKGSRSHEALEATIYNHLYTFFSRYWQDGDFISKRRYSRKERYAIPYNGEEVYLYWANHDQYYIKTGEYFADYTYRAPNGVTVHFKLRQADVEQNNVKGEKRFFLPRLDEIAWDEAKRELIIPFEYRPLTAQEGMSYGQKNQQEAILAKAVAEIPGQVKAPEALAALTAERRKPGNADVSSAAGENAGNADILSTATSVPRRYVVYRGTLRNGRTVAVIWRETKGWTAEDYERDAAFVTEHKLTEGADEIYVNGDSRIPGARSLDPIFKERMFAPVEV